MLTFLVILLALISSVPLVDWLADLCVYGAPEPAMSSCSYGGEARQLAREARHEVDLGILSTVGLVHYHVGQGRPEMAQSLRCYLVAALDLRGVMGGYSATSALGRRTVLGGV